MDAYEFHNRRRLVDLQMLREFAESFGIEKFDLVGNDSGGAVAQIFAADDPDRLRALTLTSCALNARNDRLASGVSP